MALQTCYYGNFSNNWPFHQNHNINLKETFMLIWMQKINLITHFFLKILQRNKKCVILDNLGMPGHLSTLGMPDYAHPKLYYQLAKNVCLFADKKSTSSHMLFLQYFKDMQTSCFKYFGHAWLHTPKMIVSSCRNVCCLPACHKWPSLFTSFLRYNILKNPAKLYWPTVFCHTFVT